MGFFKISSNVTPVQPTPADERTYTRRQRLKRTISAHTLTLIQTWFDILPRDEAGNVSLLLLLQRLEAVGFTNLMSQQLWNPDDRVNLDTFLDLMAKSGLIENYANVRGNYSQFNLEVPPTPAKDLDENPSPPIRYRTASVLDMLRQSVGGGIPKNGRVKVHPKPQVVSRKETPPIHTPISRFRRFTRTKVMAFMH